MDTLTCCKNGKGFDDLSFGIHIVNKDLVCDGEKGNPVFDKEYLTKHGVTEPGAYLIHDCWHSHERIYFCPFCGTKIES